MSAGWQNINPPRTGGGGWCAKHGGYLGRKCPECALSPEQVDMLADGRGDRLTDADVIREALGHGWQDHSAAIAALARLSAREQALTEALEWLRMAMGWAVFRDDSRVYASNEMRDICARINSALASAGREGEPT